MSASWRGDPRVATIVVGLLMFHAPVPQSRFNRWLERHFDDVKTAAARALR